MEGAAAMRVRHGIVLLKLLSLLFTVFSISYASEGDRHPHFRSCTEKCEKTGFMNKWQVPACKDSSVNPDFKKSQTLSLPAVFEWDCQSECRYQCMKDTESKRESFSEVPIKYHGKWPFTRYLNVQEPASVIFSVLNLLAHVQGLLSYSRLVYYYLPQRTHEGGSKAPYYEYTGLWIVYALLAVNSWVWSALFHARDVMITERLDYSSAIALLGYTLVITIIRVGSLRVEAAQVMVAAPIVAFTATHIMFLNFYDFNYGWNMKVCVIMGITQLLLWAGWAGVTHHPSRFKLWFVVLATVLSMLLEIFDFPPFWGVLDAHALWHACTIPITLLWWNFIKEDVSLRTAVLQRSGTDERKDK